MSSEPETTSRSVGARAPARFIVPALVALLFIAALIGHGRGPGVGRQALTDAAWPTWVGPARFFARPPDFFDLKVVLWGIEIHRTGRDVYTEPPLADAPFVYNYPSAWLVFAPLGWRIADVVPLAAAMIGLFLVAVASILRVNAWSGALWAAAALLSPPVLSATGHANTDIAIFALVVLAAWWHAKARTWAAGPFAVLSAAALLKLFPAAAFPALLDRRRASRFAMLACIVALGAWFALNRTELQHISRNTPRPHAYAFGCQVLASRFLDGAKRNPRAERLMMRFGGRESWERALPVAAFAGYFLWIAAATIRGARRGHDGAAGALDRSHAAVLFRAGALLYLGAFALGHSWVHREIFLLLLVPACWQHSAPPAPGAGRTCLPWFLVLILWSTSLPGLAPFAIGQPATWMLAGWLAFQLGRDYRGLLPFASRT